MMTAALLVSAAAATPVLAAAGYLAALSLASWTKAPPEPRGGAPLFRFDIVVPAHDEEAGIGDTLSALARIDYPPALCRVIVVADNCQDRTAAVARAAGALVLVRDDPARRGKGYALAHAFAEIERQGSTDAVVVVDADTTVDPDLLRAFARAFAAGAKAVQGAYGVRNPGASWRTRLLTLALALFHDVRSLGRERLGLSAGLRGNGMAFSCGVLRRVPPLAHSLVEDVEYGIALGRAGVRVHYAHDARVAGDMPSRGPAAETQRRRWEEGRAELARRHGLSLLREALRRRDAMLGDLAVDLLLPPLSTVAAAAALGAGSASVWARASGEVTPLVPWLAAILLLFIHLARGLAVSGAGLSGAAALAYAPLYLAWKVGVRIRRGAAREQAWIRTAREGRSYERERGRGDH